VSQFNIRIYQQGDRAIWIPVSSRSPNGAARALLPSVVPNALFAHGYKAEPESSPYLVALCSIQKAYMEKKRETFMVEGGPESQRKDAWRHGKQKSASLLSPTSGWVEIPFRMLDEISAEELALEIESSGQVIVTSHRLRVSPEGPMFRRVSQEVRTFQFDFRARALELWEPRCALSGATCLLEAAHIKGVATSKHENTSEMLNPYNSIILNVALHGLLDVGLISFSDNGVLLVSNALNQQDQSIYGVDTPKQITFYPEALPFLQYHRNSVFQGPAC